MAEIEIEIEYEDSDRLTAAQVAELERLAGHPLPDDYKTFLLEKGQVSFGDDGVSFNVAWRRVDGKPMAADEDEDLRMTSCCS